MTQSDCIVFGIDYNRTSRFDLAKHYYFQMFPRGFSLTPFNYSRFISALCSRENDRFSFRGFPSRVKKRRDPDVVTYNLVIDGMCKAGRFDNAVGLWKETAAKGFHPVNKVYCALAVGLCDGGKADSARIGKAQAIKLFMMKNEHEPDLVTYNVLLNYFCNELMLQEAEKLLKNMKRSGIGPDVYSYNQMIKGLRNANKADKAFFCW
ncbi:hypothetical protein V6N11_067566 [Hibiscus sabdariffa]|uniref:Pentatricopeptide repeat-containing protein n=1 Tax=Hibiscus sabdariffa TaxID=183260 RepID=A0ABR2SS29_9ROSI